MAVETLIPADAEAAAVAELTARMPALLAADEFKVGTRLPKDPQPTEFGRVVATGGVEVTLVSDGAVLTLEGFSTNEGRAQRICACMLAAVQAAARAGALGPATIHQARVVSLPANLPHPLVPDRFRFSASVSVDLRRSAA